MAFRDLDEFLVVKPVVLPIHGKDYAFPGEISARSWLRLQRLTERLQAQSNGDGLDPNEVMLNDREEEELSNELFGGVDEEMVADGRTSTQIKAVFYTLVAYHISGQEAAEAVWEAQGEAPSPNRKQRRATTPSPRRASPASSNPPPKAVSPGKRSSSSGS
jgi:hypothetical protein